MVREARVGQGAGRRRDPGVVGSRAAHQGRDGPLRERGLRRARARPLPRQDDDLAGPGGPPPDGAGRGARGPRDRGGRRVSSQPAGVLVEDDRRRRLLHGRRARAVRGHVEPERRRGRELLRRLQEVPLRWENLSGPILLIYGEKDEGVPPSEAKPLEDKLKALGKKVETIIFRGAPHGFFNDTRPGVYREECAKDAWQRTVAHFRAHLV